MQYRFAVIFGTLSNNALDANVQKHLLLHKEGFMTVILDYRQKNASEFLTELDKRVHRATLRLKSFCPWSPYRGFAVIFSEDLKA